MLSSCYMSRILNHSDTKRDFKNIVDHNFRGGGGAVAPPPGCDTHALYWNRAMTSQLACMEVYSYTFTVSDIVFVPPIDMRCDMSASLPPYPTRDSARSIIDSNIFT